MGWDAHTYSKENKKAQQAFRKAAKEVRRIAGCVDGYLDIGGLDVSTCRNMLEKAAEKADLNWNLAWDDNGMPPEAVKVMHVLSDWKFKIYAEDAWAYYSAKEFLRVSAEFGLAITFTY